MTTSCLRRASLAVPSLLALLIALGAARGAAPADASATSGGSPPVAAQASGTATVPDEVTSDALRDAVWRLERLLRRRLAAPASGPAGPAGTETARLRERLHALRRAALRLGGAPGTELARKADALQPLLREVERQGGAGASARPGSPWRPADGAPPRRVETAAHATCRDALAVGDGLFSANIARPAGGGGELWLRYTATAGGYAVASTAGSGFDTVIEVYDACPAAGGTRIARGDDELGLQARTGFRAAAGETRWLRVGGWVGSGGSLAVALGGGVAGFAGIVIREGTGQPLDFWGVEVWDAAGAFVTSTETDFDGVYVVAGLAPGTYFASTDEFFSGDGLLDELYDDLPCPGGAPQGCNPVAGTPIVVPVGDIVTGIDFALGPGAVVAGRVRDAATGLGLPGAEVTVFNQAGGFVAEAFTDVAGRYTAGGLGDGVVFALAGDFGSEYQRELYRDIPCPGSCDVTTGTPIPIEVGTTTSGIDFDLERLGAIEGTVTRAVGGAPVSFEDVLIWDDQGSFRESAFTNGLGEYRAGGLTAGTYFATSETFGQFADELYDDLPCFPSCDPTTGTPIPVTLGTTAAGIDFALNRLGTISGTVTDAVSGMPVDSIAARLYDASGDLVGFDFGFAGSYQFSGLVAGTYFVTSGSDAYRTELYDDLPCPGGAPAGCDPTAGTAVPAQLDADTTGIDFALTPLGAIAGTVTASDTGDPLDDFFIQVWDADGDFVAGDSFFAGTGTYQIGGLEAGTYFVTAERFDYVGELYDDLPCLDGPPAGCDPTTGTPVAVSLGATTGGIDFALEPKGSIAGTVRDAPTAQPIPFADVQVVDASGFFVASDSADADGDYRVDGLDTGTYFVLAFASGHSTQLYDGLPCPGGSCDPTTGTSVPVTVGAETGGIDFDLPRSGVITGVVTSTVSGPLPSAFVVLFDAGGGFHDSDFTDSEGRYSVEADAGSWFLIAEDFPDHDAQLYDGIPCPGGACDPTTGTPVPVSPGATTSGIDFVLEPARGITGRVEDSAGNPLPGVAIDLWDTAGDLVGSAVTGLGGLYQFDSGAGTFFVSTDNGLGALDELWDDVPCPLGPAFEGLCDPTIGDPVVVPSFDTLVTGIDFELSGVTIFADGFESGGTTAWSDSTP
jgi:hypothetical protein